MFDFEAISFQIISAVGTTKSKFMLAIEEAKNGDFKTSKRLIGEGEECFVLGHKAHMELLTEYASGEKVIPDLLLMHAEDQIMSAENIKLMAEELINLYEVLITEGIIKSKGEKNNA